MLAAGTTVGRYVIKRKLAEGGMAEIFLASAVGPEGFAKDVVIKRVRPFLSSDQQFVQMFIDEARLASRLNHANVVQIFDFGKHEDSYYLAMEYVRGASLWDLRRKVRELSMPFPPTLAAEIAAQVARGLQYAHSLTEAGRKLFVVHRDVTPHNVLLSYDGAVKITDFGIAKAQSTHTAPGMLKGKFAYMSPEQSRGDKVDARTDIFALGIVLWELLTGGRLFEGDSELAVLRAVQESIIPPPARVNPDVPVELSDLVMKALARPVAERFQSAFEFERALANFVLRNANSVEDSSVAHFMQLVFRDELDGTLPPGRLMATPAETLPPDDEFGLGSTTMRPGKTQTATPVVTPPQGPGAVAPPDRSRAAQTETLRQVTADVPRPKTEQMPAMRPAATSRRFDPVVVEEPSNVVVRPSLRISAASMNRPAESPMSRTLIDGDLATNSASPLPVQAMPVPAPSPSVKPPAARPTAAPPRPAPRAASSGVVPAATPGPRDSVESLPRGSRSNTALWVVVLSMVLVGLALGIWFVGQREQPAPEAPGPVEPQAATPTPVEVPPPAVAAPAAAAEPEPVDAGPKLAEAPSEPAAEPTPKQPEARPMDAKREPPPAPSPAPAVAVRKGTLVIKAVPFANVTVQGRTHEVTGVKSIQVTAGSFDVLLKHPRKTVKERVVVQPNQTTQLNFSAD